MEFVLTNGNNEWDSPQPGNYKITAPGTWRLHYGNLSQMSPQPNAPLQQ